MQMKLVVTSQSVTRCVTSGWWLIMHQYLQEVLVFIDKGSLEIILYCYSHLHSDLFSRRERWSDSALGAVHFHHTCMGMPRM